MDNREVSNDKASALLSLGTSQTCAMSAVSDLIDASEGHLTDESELECMKNAENQQLAQCIYRRAPFDDSSWHSVDQTLFRLSGLLNALFLYRTYNKIMTEHEGWRDKICEAAVELAEAGGGNTLSKFFWALLYLCLAVRKVAAAVSALKRKEVDICSHFPTIKTVEAHGQSASFAEEESRLAEEVGEAMDQTVGVRSKDTEAAVVLALVLSNDECKGAVLRCMAEQRQHELDLVHEQRAIKDTDDLQRDVEVSFEGSICPAAAELHMPAGPLLMHEVAKHGRQVLQEWMQLKYLPEPVDCSTEGMMHRLAHFQKNTLVCAAYLKSSRILEVYMIQLSKAGFGSLQLIDVLHDVRGLPAWASIAQQDFSIREDGLLAACVEGFMSKDGWDTSSRWKRNRLGREYVRKRPATTVCERIVSKALKDRGISGGSLNIVMRGGVPSHNVNAEGFWTLEACTVVAGLALHFDSTINERNVEKWAKWQTFDNIIMEKSQCLTLGHCRTSAQSCGRSDNANKVSVIAAKDSPLWDVTSMWG